MTDAVWLDVLPSMQGFATELAKGSTKAAKETGKSSGTQWAKSFAGAAGDAGSSKVVAELEAAAKRTKRAVSDQTVAIGRARASQREAAAKVILAEQALADARTKGDTAKAQAAELRLAGARDRVESASAKLLSVEDQLKAAHREHKTVTGQLEDATRDLADATDDQVRAADGAKRSLDGSKDSFGQVAVKAAAAAGAVALLVDAFGNAAEAESATDRLAASMDLSAEQAERAGGVAGNLYASAYGENIGEVTGAVEAVMSSISGMSDASEADLEAASKAALNMASIFDVDVSEAARNVGVLIKTGLVADAEEGFDLMTAALQQVPKALRGEVTDAAHEYSTFFAQLGLNGEQAMGLLVSASEGGQFAIDKTGDALKELTIRATDMSTTSVDAYKAAGLSADDMAARFLAGGDDASGALSDLVTGLKGIEDPTERANAAIALFGTPLEDLGTENIPTFLDSLAGMDSTLGDVTGAAAKADQVLNDNFSTGLTTLTRGFQDTLKKGLEPLLGPATDFLAWVTNTPGVLEAFGIGLGALAVAWGVYTIAQWAANSAMLASPLTWVVVGIAALAAGIVLLVKNWGTVTDWLREKWEPIGAWFVGLWEGISDAVGTAWDWVSDKLGTGWDWLVQHVFDPIGVAVDVVIAGFLAYRDLVLGAWEAVRSGVAAAWDWLDRYVFSPIGTAIDLVVAGFEFYRDLVLEVWARVRSGSAEAWQWIDRNVFSPIKTGIDAVGQAFDATAAWIGTAWEKVKEAAAAPVRFVVNTIYTNGIKATWDKIADAVGLDLRLPTIRLPFADGGMMPGYTPGRDVHRFYSPTGGLLELSGGEPILRPEAGRVLGRGWVDGVNAAARTGGVAGVESFLGGPSQGFAEGGFWDSVGGFVSGVGRRVRDVVVDVASVLADPVNAITGMLTAPIDRLLGNVGGGVLGQMLVEYPRRVVEGIVAKARDLVGGLGGDFTGDAGEWVRPSRGRVTSEYGPRWGSFHAGIDIGGGGPTFAAGNGRVAETGWNVLPGRTGVGILLDHGAGTYSYYGHNPVDGVKVRAGELVAAGQRIGAQGSTGNVTGEHLHFEAHRGGLGRTVNPRSMGVFDSGGYLPPGVSVVENRTGSPEPVLTSEQWESVIEGRGGPVRLHRDDLDYLAAELADGVLAGAQVEAGRALQSVARSAGGHSRNRGGVW